MKKTIFAGVTLPLAVLNLQAKEKQQPKMNVLFLVMDDLRPELGCYGHPEMKTPSIDRLAAEGTLFNNAFCNVPVSGASRASLMTGLRPTVDRFYDVDAKIDVDAPGVETLPQYLKENGYVTYSNSKIIHSKDDAKQSWTSVWYPEGRSKTWRNYIGQENLDNETTKHGPEAFECIDVDDDAYFDGMTAKKTIQQLRELKASGKPFFIASGILKPHLPFNAPKKYWDLYPLEDQKLPSDYEIDRSSFPDKAFHTWGELRYYKNIPEQGKIQDDAEALKLIQGYKACVSYADAQVGRILDELKRLGLDKNTIVVLFGDHGWSLGDHGLWCKHSNFSRATNTPLIISVPGLPRDKKVDKAVELVDLYPTICSLVGLPAPKHTEGADMQTLLAKKDDPNWKNAAVVKWHDGLTFVTPEYRYTEWTDKNDRIESRMLFDVKTDKKEDVNLAEKPAYQKLVQELSEKLRTLRGPDFLKVTEKGEAVKTKAKRDNKGKKKNKRNNQNDI